MVGKFKAFNGRTINDELLDLPQADFLDLCRAMELYQANKNVGYTVKNYGDDLMMIKGSGQGRCLWFARETEIVNGTEVESLIVLLVYKKESQEAPKRVLDTARERLGKYRGGR